MADFAVVLTRRDKRDPVALAKALASCRKTPLQDQMHAAKDCWGVVGEHLSGPDAKVFQQGLQAGGIETMVIPESSFAPLPDAQTIKAAEPGWLEGLLLVAAASWTSSSTTTHTEHQGPSTGQKILSAGLLLATGMPIRIGPKSQEIKREKTQTEHFFMVDLLYGGPRGPATKRCRIEADKFDYSFLKERRVYHMLGNLKMLLESAVQASSEAWKNLGTTVILEGKPVASMEYRSVLDLERETRWLLTLRGAVV